MKRLLPLALLLGSVTTPVAADWFTLSRHGDCVPFAQLAQRLEVFSGVQTPAELLRAYRRQGQQAQLVPLPYPPDAATVATTPQAWLLQLEQQPRWMLVQRQHCTEIVPLR